MSPRDFVWFEHRRRLSDGTAVILAYSTVHPDCPERKGFVRGEIRGTHRHTITQSHTHHVITHITQLQYVLTSNVVTLFLLRRVRLCHSSCW